MPQRTNKPQDQQTAAAPAPRRRHRAKAPEQPSPTPAETPAMEGTVLGPDCGTTIQTKPRRRKAIDPLVKKLLIEATPAATQTLIDLLHDPKSSPRLRCQVAEVILNRVYGKAVQPIDASLGGNGDPVVIAFTGVLADWAK